MGSRASLVLKAAVAPMHPSVFNYPTKSLTLSLSSSSRFHFHRHGINSRVFRKCWSSTAAAAAAAAKSSSFEPPDLTRLAETARISLTRNEVEEFAPKIGQVIDWFGQLQAVDLNSVEPAIRADTEGENLREDIPETFENRDAMIASVPSYEEPYIKVPKVLNKE